MWVFYLAHARKLCLFLARTHLTILTYLFITCRRGYCILPFEVECDDKALVWVWPHFGEEGNVHAIETKLEKGWNTDHFIQLLQPLTDGQKMKVIFLLSWVQRKNGVPDDTPLSPTFHCHLSGFCSVFLWCPKSVWRLWSGVKWP